MRVRCVASRTHLGVGDEVAVLHAGVDGALAPAVQRRNTALLQQCNTALLQRRNNNTLLQRRNNATLGNATAQRCDAWECSGTTSMRCCSGAVIHCCSGATMHSLMSEAPTVLRAVGACAVRPPRAVPVQMRAGRAQSRRRCGKDGLEVLV